MISKVVKKALEVVVPRSGATSLSDNQYYPQVCIRASNNLRTFNKFRRNPVYNQILEHVSFEQGEKYAEIFSSDSEIISRVEELKENDLYGGPKVYDYKKMGRVSPTTLRYIKVLFDLKNQFGDLTGKSIAEIGVGYGGQCRILSKFFRIGSYTLIDLQPALMLAQRFLDHFPLSTVIEYKTMNELPKKTYDLVISNYAFSELPRAVQAVYMEKVILNSSHGYITFNDINPESFNSYTLDELLDLIPNSKVIEEKPLTHQNNCIIVW